MVKMKAPANCESLSVSGIEYQVVKGMIEIPDEDVALAMDHGFTRAPTKDELAQQKADAKARADAEAEAKRIAEEEELQRMHDEEEAAKEAQRLQDAAGDGGPIL